MAAQRKLKSRAKLDRDPKKYLHGPLPKLLPDEQTLTQLRGMARIQCTTRECAAIFGVDHVTFIKFKKRWPQVEAIFEQGQEEGRASLRRTQFKHAETAPAMAIFLGKNYLGQSDRLEQRVDANVAMDMTTTWIIEKRPEKLPKP